MTLASGGNNLAICDRCRMTFKRSQLMIDPNATGLRVCKDCRDQYNPYRLPPRTPDPIALPWIRPMVHLVAPIYRISGKMPIAPEQAPLSPIVNEDAKGIQATGNIPPPYTDFPLPNIEYDYDYPKAEEEDYLPPRLKKN